LRAEGQPSRSVRMESENEENDLFGKRQNNPFDARGKWLKGALHTHTTGSDGELTPDELSAAYREQGFDFVCLTDHLKVTPCENPPAGLLVMSGYELPVTTHAPERYWHFVAIGADEITRTEFSSALDAFAHLRKTAPFVMLAHPYWSNVTGRDLMEFDGLDAVEVYNTRSEFRVGRGYAEYPWDFCLSSGVRLPAVAADDTHVRREVGRAWVMVRTADATPDGILRAVREGMFYSTCGPEIRNVETSPDGLRVEMSPCDEAHFVASDQKGARIVAEGEPGLTSASYLFRGPEKYVRVECVDRFRRKAWTNPFYR